MLQKLLLTKRLLFIALLFAGINAWSQTYFDLSTGNYSQDFSAISGWTTDYAAGTGAANWKKATSVATSTVNNATVFATGAAGGVQKSADETAMVLLATSTNSAATDLLLNFTNRTAGTISVDWAKVLNGTVNNTNPRNLDLKIQYSVNNGTSFTDLTGYTIPRVFNNAATTDQSGTLSSIALPAVISGKSQVVIRFYVWNNGLDSGQSGNRPKIAIDNIAVTSTSSGPSVSIAGTVTETNLAGATITVNLSSETYIAGTLIAAGFTLTGAPAGVTVASVAKNSTTQATLTLAYNNTDFDTNATVGVTVAASQLTSNTQRASSNTLTFTAVTETVTTSPTSVSGLTYFEGSGPSTATQFTLSATNLQSGGGTLTISVPGGSNFEVSTTSATTGFAASVTRAYTGTGTISPNTVWVRLKGGLTGGAYSDVVTISGGKASNTMNVSGTVTAPPPANDLCGGAATLTVNDATVTNGTLVGATYTAFTSGNTKKDVWYKFTAGCNGSHKVTITGFTGDVDAYLFSGASCPTNNNNAIEYAATSNSTETITYALSSGQTYHIRVIAFDVTAESSTFTIRVQSVNEIPTVTTSTASAITYQGATIPGTAVVAGCSTAVGSGYGVYYSTTSGFPDGSGTQVVATNMAGNSFSVNLTGLTPLTTYYYKTYATNAAGTGYSTQGSFTTAAFVLDAPVATAATNTSTSGFTAHWLPVTGATSYRLDVSESATFGTNTPTTDLIISEYVEGSSNNKYIEIYNGTGAAVNLSDYQLRSFANGSTSATTGTPAMTGTLANGATVVYKNSGASNSVYAGTAITNSAINFNGNDAIAIWKVSTAAYVDIFGSIGHNPGTAWTSASNSTVDKTLIRKSTVTHGITNPNTTDFPTLETEWTQQNIDVTTDLGSHTYNGQQDDLLPGYANLTVNGLWHDVAGLDAGTTYYYRVRAFGNSTTSVNSNAISVLTGFIKIWDNGVWSGDGLAPTIIDEAIIQDSYSTETNGTFNASLLTVSEGTLTVDAGTSITVNGIINVDGGLMVVESNANVLQINEDSDNSGLVTVYRQSPALKRLDYKMWSSPVAGEVMSVFSPMTENSRFYAYNTVTDFFTGISNSSPFGTGVGYLIRVPNNHNASTPTKWNGIFKGVPHNGYMEIPVIYNTDHSQTGGNGVGYNAIGNPYMSTISAEEFYAENAGKIDGTLYFWRKENATPGSAYIAYTAGLGGTGNSGDAIQVGQGFIVNVTSPTAGHLVFNNQMRIANTDDMSYRSAQATEKHRFWINLTNAAGANSQALVGYTANATLGIDSGIDGKLLADNSAALYTVAAATKLMIQGRPMPFANTDVVVLGYKATSAVNHKIALDHFDGLFAQGQHVYLKDKALNVVHDLNGGDYIFATAVGTFEDRFEIVYTTDGALGTDNPVVSAESIAVYKDGNVLNVASGNTEIAAIAIYDIRGRLLYSNDNINANETSVTTLQAAQQVLVVQVTTANNIKVSKKVVF